MKWLPLAKRFPQWALAGFIILGSSLLFFGWLMFRGFNETGKGKTAETPQVLEFDASNAILCGNTLIDSRSGKILAREWLEGFGSSTPPIAKVMTEEELVIVAANNGAVGAFSLNGKPKPMLRADGKPVVFAAFDSDFRHVVFPREGNLWQGLVDWTAGKILNPKKFTDTGYFRDDIFRGPWLWHENDLLVSLMGKTLEVGFGGTVKEVPIRIGELQRGMSPDGSFALITSGGWQIGVVDLVTGENQKFPIGQRLGKLLWLTPRKVAIVTGQDLLTQYDHNTNKLEGAKQIQAGIRDILGPSPDGSHFLVVSANAILIFDSVAKTHVKLKIQFDEVDWVDNENLLCSSNAVETEIRGLWLVKRTGEAEKISNLPIDSVGRASPLTVVKADGAAYFISGGNLWRFDVADKSLKQITQNEKLPPQLQLFNR